jgi:hypothetical protein
MKKFIILAVFALITITAGAQEKKPTAKASCCANKEVSAKTMTADEVAKCQAKCKAEGKVCSANQKATCKKDGKKCCATKA